MIRWLRLWGAAAAGYFFFAAFRLAQISFSFAERSALAAGLSLRLRLRFVCDASGADFLAAQRFVWAAEIKARAAALIVRFFLRPSAWVGAGVAAPRIRVSCCCSLAIWSLMAAACRS
ncbi:MAG: hypothetical protein IT579_10580 [Verrucomicrobia subdivision 3 bacterium]|nr:hypothetical protein [Verrucomicrobiota bacterium]MCC6821166.1 hypothetical protein [Limisphaerales bacterium]